MNWREILISATYFFTITNIHNNKYICLLCKGEFVRHYVCMKINGYILEYGQTLNKFVSNICYKSLNCAKNCRNVTAIKDPDIDILSVIFVLLKIQKKFLKILVKHGQTVFIAPKSTFYKACMGIVMKSSCLRHCKIMKKLSSPQVSTHVCWSKNSNLCDSNWRNNSVKVSFRKLPG